MLNMLMDYINTKKVDEMLARERVTKLNLYFAA